MEGGFVEARLSGRGWLGGCLAQRVDGVRFFGWWPEAADAGGCVIKKTILLGCDGNDGCRRILVLSVYKLALMVV